MNLDCLQFDAVGFHLYVKLGGGVLKELEEIERRAHCFDNLSQF